ncbi:hypothetical protein ACFE04_005379 [Oxalis oulophora]
MPHFSYSVLFTLQGRDSHIHFAKNWSHLWQDKAVELHQSVLANIPNEANINDLMRSSQRKDFIQFSTQYVAKRSSEVINKFSFSFTDPKEFLQEINHLLQFPKSYEMKMLSLDFSDPERVDDIRFVSLYKPDYCLPHYIYQHKKLMWLKLFSCNFTLTNGLCNFSALLQLSVGWTKVKSSDIQTILISCPLLESLSLHCCHGDWRRLEILAPADSRLKVLVLDRNDFSSYCIHVLCLTCFKFNGLYSSFAILGDMKFLQEVEIFFDQEIEYHGFTNLLRSFRAAKKLTVCSYIIRTTPSCQDSLSYKFTMDVRELNLRISLHDDELGSIKKLLKSCPLLETLYINITPHKTLVNFKPHDMKQSKNHGVPYYKKILGNWKEAFLRTKFFNETLKVVEVRGFKGTENELDFLRHLLQIGCKLRDLQIYVLREKEDAEAVESYIEKAQRVGLFRKISGDVVVSIH